VPSRAVVIGFDPGESRGFELIYIRPRPCVDELLLVSCEESFRDGVIPTHTGAAQGSSDIMVAAVLVEFTAGVLRSAVAVEYHPVRGVSPAKCHVQSVNDEAGPHVVGDRPAHDGS